MSLYPIISPVAAIAYPEISSEFLRFLAHVDNVTLNGSDVSSWADLSGNADHFTQTTATDQPAWDASGSPAGEGSLTFDGSTEGMRTGTFSAVSQPQHFFMVVNPIAWGDGDVFFAAVNSDILMLRQQGSSPALTVRAGTGNACSNSDATVGDWHVVNVFFSGSSSTITVDDDDPSTGNPGTGGGGATYIQMGREADGSNDCNIEVAEFCAFNAAVTGGDLTALNAYFTARYGIAT